MMLWNGMLLIEYEIKNSKTHGNRVFAKQDIKKATLVAKVCPNLDGDISADEYNSLSEKEKKEISNWASYDEQQKKYYIDSYNTKIMYVVANRNIKAGEELLQKHLKFETEEEYNTRNIKD